MEFKVNREILGVPEEIYDGVQEQSVELDYVLPDYYPEICRIIQTRVEPEIAAYQVFEDKLTYELSVQISVLYCGEQSKTVQCVHQKLHFAKTLEFGRSCEQANARLSAKCDYANCRAVNSRRIDLRGAVSVKLRVTGLLQQPVVCDAFGLSAQLRKEPVEYAAKTLRGCKDVVVHEDIELSGTKPSALHVLRAEAVLTDGEPKAIAGKLVCKGEAQLRILYAAEEGMEPMQVTLPYSQIVDLDGVDEAFASHVHTEVAGLEVTPFAKNDGEARVLQCELTLRLCCMAVKSGVAELVTDAFSTQHPCTLTQVPVPVPQMPQCVQDAQSASATLMQKDGELTQVYDAWCTPKNVGTRMDEEQNALIVSGMLCYCVLARDGEGQPVLLEQEAAFDHALSMQGGCAQADIRVTVGACSYTLTGANTVAVKAELRLDGMVQGAVTLPLVTELGIDGENRLVRDGDYALKLYYGVENEAVWDIAKKYSTSVSAILEENHLTEERLAHNGMLLIPIVG